MTIEEATKLLSDLEKDQEFRFGSNYRSALELGIEALDTVKKWREQHRDLGFLLLPSETED
uniref:Uncharacterized protein n=1 Tax=viral metagenome TaxID=1070528 RepID=A0A6M3Y638_9ZZZZ